MDRTFEKHKWINLMSFSVMYSLVYLGRFNVNNLMDRIATDIYISAKQQDIISMSVFLSYAMGSFINGYLADRYGAKRIIMTGGLGTCFLNMVVSVQSEWSGILLICFINGYFQSMIWVGGISLLSRWLKSGECGKGIGIANFFSGMSHTVAYVIPIMVLSMFPGLGWRGTFIIPMALLLLFVVLFGILARENPPQAESTLYAEGSESPREAGEVILRRIAAEKRTPWRYFFSKPKFWWWCIIAVLSSICRYGLLNWIPLYFGGPENSILSDTFFNLTLPVGMAFGTLIVTWIAGTKMNDNKGVVVTAMAAICGMLVIVFPMVADIQTVFVGIFFTGFALYGINGILWVYAIEQGKRYFSGSAAGILNAFAYMGAFAEGLLFPAVIRIFGNLISVFILMELLCICMVIFGMLVCKKNTLVEPEIRE